MSATPVSLLERLRQSPAGEDWARFVDIYTPLMLTWSHRLGLDEHDTADLAQEVFAALVEHLPRFEYDPARSFRAWLKTVFLNAWRKKQRRPPAGPLDADRVADPDPALEVDEAEHRRYVVRRALGVMQAEFEPATWRACWELVVQDRPAAEVAAELGTTVNAVYLAKSRVLRRLRTELAGLID